MASLAGCAFAPDARAKRRSSPPARAARALSSRATLRRQGGAARLAASASGPGRRRGSPRGAPVSVRALVNVDLGPSAILGASVMVSAIGLYQVRASRPEVSRDQDVFFSSIGLLTGGILTEPGACRTPAGPCTIVFRRSSTTLSLGEPHKRHDEVHVATSSAASQAGSRARVAARRR